MDGLSILEFFAYDEDETARHVDIFFKNFKRIARMAGEDPSALKSPVITDMPVNHDGRNHVEDRLVDHANATDLAPKIMNDVRFALSHISQRSKLIIIGTYIDEIDEISMAERLLCSKTSLKTYKKVALNEFADSLSSPKTILKIDLHEGNGKELVVD